MTDLFIKEESSEHQVYEAIIGKGIPISWYLGNCPNIRAIKF